MTGRIVDSLFDRLTDDGAEAGLDLPPDAGAAEPKNFLRHVAALALTKSADGLMDPKLVLSWLLTSQGAPAWVVGLLVPVREAGALLPQLLASARIRQLPRRKWAWTLGSAVQGLAVLSILLAALALEGTALGLAVLVSLAVFAVARSVSSVSYKDVLGRTVGKGRRGTATGLAGTIAAAAIVVFALVLMSGVLERLTLVLVALAFGGLCWLLSAWIFAGLEEEADPGKGDAKSLRATLAQLRLLREDATLGRFVAVRGLLTATALAPPYIVLLAGGEEGFGPLGALVLASALAALVSSYVWGRLSDRSSRLVLILAGFMGAAALALAILFSAAGMQGSGWALPLALFALMLAHQGVRRGRSTYLVDMAPADLRPAYTAVANTVIGVLLILGGVFGWLANLFGAATTLGVFVIMAAAAAVVALRLDEVSGNADGRG
ncbi:MAG: MFS transporter [Paracoccaceae bacterium]